MDKKILQGYEYAKEYFAKCYEITQAKVDTAYSGMAETMRELYSKGYTLAVLSNKPDKLVKMIVKNLFPDGIISVAMGQTDLPKKPDPTAPLTIARQLGFEPSQTAFIGDSDTDVPCMKLIKDNGGHAISLYEEKADLALQLLEDGRVNHVSRTDYTDSSDLDIYVKNILIDINKRTDNE